MGQDASTPVDENTPPETLESRTVESVARFIRDGRAKKIVVMTGAGISTSAGIPDFRSPDTGLYSNLARLNLPYPEAVFDISFFRNNPLPFYTLAHELYPGTYRPSIAHSFIRLLSDKGLLLKLFTQNIDCLEREAGVPDEKIVEAHGSFARQRCIDCGTPYPDDQMKETIAKKDVPHCTTPQCNGLVKPDIVFFGEPLPTEFFKNRELPGLADLCIVMGTSLTVQPFASLPGFCSEGVPRLLINLEQVGSLGTRPDDVLLLGDCDAGVRKLASALGWLDELETLWEATNPHKETQEKQHEPPKTKDEALEAEIATLTSEVDKSLKISSDHTDWLRKHLAGRHDLKPEKSSARAGAAESTKPVLEEATQFEDKESAAGRFQVQQPSNGTTTEQAPDELDESDDGSGLGHVFPHIAKKSSV
ncbi:MAG: SIR2 family histone deacetylase [Lasallia pustulata]|uniref:SIR2 family histone deacetylase n=1 Tax=Lasallia pustulata TaxID=136370 RepID=A0A5M8PXB3_9LECA|nr:MAG: SIR2 family histone deacetylase [Lasallia pustulata]